MKKQLDFQIKRINKSIKINNSQMPTPYLEKMQDLTVAFMSMNSFIDEEHAKFRATYEQISKKEQAEAAAEIE